VGCQGRSEGITYRFLCCYGLRGLKALLIEILDNIGEVLESVGRPLVRA